jgi:hypothetical protein
VTELISIATATAHPGRADDLARELRARIEPTRAHESGPSGEPDARPRGRDRQPREPDPPPRGRDRQPRGRREGLSGGDRMGVLATLSTIRRRCWPGAAQRASRE